jgi:hypothetical protein
MTNGGKNKLFKIYDGRSQFYQWDLNRKLIVEDESIKQVHYCNRTGDCSLVCEVYDLEGKRVADVPNVLLQTDWRINVYGYDIDHTKHSEVFDVVKRSKPADYVYTETETLNYNTLLERMNGIEENIADTVNEYLKENPVEVDLTGYATETYVEAAIETIELTPGPAGPQGEPGPAGKDGYTPVKGVDYFDGAPGKDGAAGKDGKDGAPGKDGSNYVLTEADKQEIAGMVEVTGGGGSGEGVETFAIPMGWSTPKADEIAMAEDLWRTYKTDGYIKPINLYFTNDWENVEVVEATTDIDNQMLYLSTGWSQSNQRYQKYYYFDGDTYTFSSYGVDNFPTSKAWWWDDGCAGASCIELYNLNPTNTLKIVGYWGMDSTKIATYEITTSHNNSFQEESGTRYYVSEPYHDYRTSSSFYFENDNGCLYYRNEQGDDLFSSGFYLLGVYYWC